MSRTPLISIFTGFFHFPDVSISDPLFSDEMSHMVFEVSDLRYHSDIYIEFKPSAPDGLLFYASQRLNENSGDFIAISIHGGQLSLRMSLGSDVPLVLVSDREISVGKSMATSSSSLDHLYYPESSLVYNDLITTAVC